MFPGNSGAKLCSVHRPLSSGCQWPTGNLRVEVDAGRWLHELRLSAFLGPLLAIIVPGCQPEWPCNHFMAT